MPRWLFLKVDGADVRGVASIFNQSLKMWSLVRNVDDQGNNEAEKQSQLNLKTVTTKLLAAKQRAVDCGYE